MTEGPAKDDGEVSGRAKHKASRRWPRRAALWTVGVVAVLAAVLVLLLTAINTGPGRAFLVDRVADFKLKSGLNVRIDRIDGSLYGRMVIYGLEVRDPKGAFLTAAAVTIDWRPSAYLQRNLVVREVSAPNMRLLRLPQLEKTPPDPNRKLLPDINLALGSIRLDALTIEPAVTGKRHMVGIRGSGDLADGRLRLDVDLAARQAPGVAGGDRLTARVDVLPAANRLLIEANLTAPAGGLVDSYAKLGGPLQARISGRGDWARWSGTAVSHLGASPLADLRINAQTGTFTIAGQLRPDLIVKGQASQLFSPAVRVDLSAMMAKKRQLHASLALRSDALELTARGGVDLARSRFDDLRLVGRLLRPGAIAPNLTGRDVQVAVALEGRFGQPRVDYVLSATAIGFGKTTVEGLKAAGRTVVDSKRTLIPIHATARRVTGLNAAAGGLLTNLRVDGDLAIGDGKILSDNLKLRSDRVDSTLILVADLATGRYTAALKGRVNDYDIAGVGRLDLVTDAKLVSGANGGFGMKGHIEANTRRLYNKSVEKFLGGNAKIVADVALNEAGVISVNNLRVTAPQFRVTQGNGAYSPDGRIAFRAAATSTQYGPIGVSASGTASRPVLHLTAARPNVGVQLRDVSVDVVGVGEIYRIIGRGGSPYGGFTGDLTVAPGKPLSIDIASFRLADLTVRGRLVQSSAGPFTGALDVSGSGLSGVVRLSAAGAVQKADADVRAQNARLPLQPETTVGSGVLRASAILYPKAPAVTADIRIDNLRQGLLSVASAQAKVRYQSGNGTVGLVAKGSRGAPFNVAVQASLTPELIRANLRGGVGSAPISLAAPAEIRKVSGGWRLEPATLVLPQGQIDISGQTGATTQLHARLRNLDLSLVQAFAPSLGLTGSATGVVDASLPNGGAMPTVSARVNVDRFSRVGLATASPPVNIALRATLSDRGGDVSAVVRRGSGVIGRLQARLQPVSGGASWSQRLMQAPLSGGIRYSGPADVLWAMTGISGQQLSGPIAVAADVSGRVNQPSLNGVIRADDLRYENTNFGTVIKNIALRGRFTRSDLEITSLSGHAGQGTVSAAGVIGLDAASGFPMELRVILDRAQLAGSDSVSATVSGTLEIAKNAKQGASITGDLLIPEARYQIVRQGAADVPQLLGVRRRNQPPPEAGKEKAAAASQTDWNLNIRIRAPNRLFVSGMGLDSEWRSDLRVTGTASAPAVAGQLQVVRGSFTFAGRRLEITSGDVRFDGGQLKDPLLNITASTTVQSVTAAVNITGRAQNPQIGFSSTPGLPQDEILARLLFGNSAGSLTPVQAIQLAAALNSFRGGGGGLDPLGNLRAATGLSRLRVVSSDQGAAVAAGQYISRNVYLEVVTDGRGFTATQLEIALSKSLSLLSQVGAFGGSNLNLRYSRDY